MSTMWRRKVIQNLEPASNLKSSQYWTAVASVINGIKTIYFFTTIFFNIICFFMIIDFLDFSNILKVFELEQTANLKSSK